MLNSNMGCIETRATDVEEFLTEMLNSNMGCIETRGWYRR